MDIIAPVRGQFDRLLEATRERPGAALAIAIGGGAALGFFASKIVFRERVVNGDRGDKRAECAGEQGHPIRRANDSMAISGESTPASSVAGNNLLSKVQERRKV